MSYPRLFPCPPPGGGRNRWTFVAALWCRRKGFTPDYAYNVLCREMARSGNVNHDDIVRSIRRIFSCAFNPAVVGRRKLPPGTFTGSVEDAFQILEESRYGMRPVNGTAFIRQVLGQSPFVCFGSDPRHTTTVPIGDISETVLAGATVLLPNPLHSPSGFNLQGRPSTRCNSMAAAREYQIIEYDNLSLAQQATRIQHLRRVFRIPLVAIVFSGRASWHCWFLVRHLTPAQQAGFFNYAIDVTGADPAHRSPVQLTRMPFGVRPETGAFQALHFFNPSALPI
jgi:hypothetical protein